MEDKPSEQYASIPFKTKPAARTASCTSRHDVAYVDGSMRDANACLTSRPASPSAHFGQDAVIVPSPPTVITGREGSASSLGTFLGLPFSLLEVSREGLTAFGKLKRPGISPDCASLRELAIPSRSSACKADAPPFNPLSSPSSGAPTFAPHFQQNESVSRTLAPHAEQNMASPSPSWSPPSMIRKGRSRICKLRHRSCS